MPFGMDELEWDELVDSAVAELVSVAEARATITYGEFATRLRRRPPNRTLDPHRGPMPSLLAAASSRVREEDPDAPLVSALVYRAAENLPGEGFFKLAARVGYPVGDKLEFWARHVAAVHAWAAQRGERGTAPP